MDDEKQTVNLVIVAFTEDARHVLGTKFPIFVPCTLVQHLRDNDLRSERNV